MKAKLIFLAVILVVLFSCSLPVQVSFEEVSRPYIEKYGTPSEVSDFQANGNNHYVIYRYPEIKYDVCFVEIQTDSWSVYFERDYTSGSPGHP